MARTSSALYEAPYNVREAGLRLVKTLIDSIPLEDESERKKRKASKYVSYNELEAIPAQIRVFREGYEKKRNKKSTLEQAKEGVLPSSVLIEDLDMVLSC